MSETEQPVSNRASLTRCIMLAVLIWGLLLALGIYRFGGNQPLLRAAIVVGCTLGFLGLWLAALASRRRSTS